MTMADKKPKKADVGEVFLRCVRLSFAEDIWRPKTFRNKDGSESIPRFSCNFLINKKNPGKAKYLGKQMPMMEALKRAKKAALQKKFGERDGLKKKVKPENHCVRDGNLEDWDGYEDHWFISASNKTAPGIVDISKRPLKESDGRPYSGCYVNAIVRLWAQPPGTAADGSPIPLRVNGSLEAIQFLKDGERFGATPVDTDTAFDDESEEYGEEFGDDGEDDDDDDDDIL